MRFALKTKSKTRGPVSTVKTLPAPVGGWNNRDALAEMPPTDAVVLDNFMPKASYVEMRGGSASFVERIGGPLVTENVMELTTEDLLVLVTEDTVSGINGTIKTLAVHTGLTGTNKLFAMTEVGIYETTNPGAPSASLLARTNGKHQWTMYGDGTTNWLIAANGVDKIAYYDGTTWMEVDDITSPAIVGLPTTDIVGVVVFKGRVIFIPKNSLSFWYLPAATAGGTLTEFDLSSQTKRGGYLMAAATWTRDAGDGQDDVLVFVTSEGDAIVYQGDNPSSAANWNKVGTFYVGKPLGRRCLTQYAGDILIITEYGIFPISASLQSAIIDYQYALSSKIQKAFIDAGRTYGDLFGWESTIYPLQQALIVNIPYQEDGKHYQYVMNTQTKAWCRFTEWNAETFALFDRELYFARGNVVYKAWTGQHDNQNNIVAYGKQAFNYFNSMGQLKKFKQFEPVLSSNGPVSYGTDIDVDFEDKIISNLTQTPSLGTGMIWGQALWGSAVWGGSPAITQQWATAGTWPGYCGAAKLQVETNSFTVQWLASNIMLEVGAIF